MRPAREARVEQSREIAALESLDRQLDKGGGAEVAHAVLLEIGKPEALVAAVVNFRNIDRAAYAVAPIEKLERRPRAARRIVRKAVGIENVVLKVSEGGAVDLIRPRLDGEICDAGLAAVVLRAHGACLQLEFADGLGARTELVVAAALEVKPAERDAFDQDLVRVKLAAIDGSLERASYGSRQAVEDEFLNLALAVADQNRPGVEFFLRYVTADFSGRAFEERGVGADRDLLGDRAQVQGEIQREGLGHMQNDVLAHGGLESAFAG